MSAIGQAIWKAAQLGAAALLWLALGGSAQAAIFCGRPIPPAPPPPDPPACNTSSNTCNCYRSPCSVATLNYSFAVTDLSVSAPGLPLQMTRTHDSRRFTDGIMGKSWIPKYGGTLLSTSRIVPSGVPNQFSQWFFVRWSDGRRSSIDLLTGPGQLRGIRALHGEPATIERDATSGNTIVRQILGKEAYVFAPPASTLGIYKPVAVKYVDASGQELSFTVDAQNRVQRITNNAAPGRHLDLNYGADGRIASATDHTNRSVFYTYDSNGQLIEVTDAAGRKTRYSYTDIAHGQKALSRIADHWGRTITDITYYPGYTYVKSYTEAGETWTYQLQANQKTSKMDSSGNSWLYTYDLGGRVTNELYPTSESKTIGYDGFGNVAGIIDERGIWNTYLYNANQTLKRVTRDNGGPQEVRFEYTYNDAAFPEKPTAVTARKPDDTLDVHWQSSRYDYHPAGAPSPGSLYHVYRVRDDGTTLDTLATYLYNSKGQVTRHTDATGDVTDYEYDATGNMTKVTTPANNDAGTRPVTLYGYDSLGRVTTLTDPSGRVTTYTYDAVDRVKTVTLPKPTPVSPLIFTTTYSYDNYDTASGLLFTHATDPNGQVTKHGYDQYGQLIRIVDPLLRVTAFTYTRGLMTSLTDPNANVTTYEYNSRRRLSRTVFPDGAFETYAYSPDGLLAQTTSRRSQTVNYTYDRHSRLSQRSYSTGGSVIYTYAGQKLTQAVDSTVAPTETHLFAYDPSYRVASESQAGRGTVNYQYLADDSVSALWASGGPTATYTYYPSGELNIVAWTPVAGSFKYRYDLAGQYQSVTFPNNQSRAFSYDGQGRLTQTANLVSGGANLATYSYAYDLNHATGANDRLGQRVSVTATVPSQSLNNHLTKYEYDPLYQLTRTTYPNVAPFIGEIHSWTYDAIGNRLTNTVGATTQTYAYQKIGANPLNWQRLLNDGQSAYTYDPNGNTLTRNGPGGNFTFGWNADNRLTSISGAATASYAYDYQGRRASKTISGATTAYLYEGSNLIRESGASSADYLFGPGIDEPLAMSRGGQIHYYLVDGLGSISAITNTSGAVQNKYLYDAWGATKSLIGTLGNPLGYTARESAEAGTLFYRARYYQPSIGRFLEEDPLGHTDGPSTYAYVRNSPMMFADPSGERLDPRPRPHWYPDWMPDSGPGCTSRARTRYDEAQRGCQAAFDQQARGCMADCPPDEIPFDSVGCLIGAHLNLTACGMGAAGAYATDVLFCTVIPGPFPARPMLMPKPLPRLGS